MVSQSIQPVDDGQRGESEQSSRSRPMLGSERVIYWRMWARDRGDGCLASIDELRAAKSPFELTWSRRRARLLIAALVRSGRVRVEGKLPGGKTLYTLSARTYDRERLAARLKGGWADELKVPQAQTAASDRAELEDVPKDLRTSWPVPTSRLLRDFGEERVREACEAVRGTYQGRKARVLNSQGLLRSYCERLSSSSADQAETQAE